MGYSYVMIYVFLKGGVYSVIMWRFWILGLFWSGVGEGKMYENEVSL